MKKLTLFILMCAWASIAFAQQRYYYGFSSQEINVRLDGKQTTCALVTGVEKFSPAYEAGIWALDLITAIDGEPVNEDVWNTFGKKPQAVLSIKSMGNRTSDDTLTGVPVQSDDYFSEFNYATGDVAGWVTQYVTEKTLGIEPIEIMADPEADFYGYATFDFEFVENNILLQKEIAPSIEPRLTNVLGLKRDSENPDLLIFIEYYSDKREQYIPPQQQVQTRYGTSYNYFTHRLESRQYIESYETGDYTRTQYLSKLSIVMADAKKMRAGNTGDVTVWQAGYETLYKEKANHKEFGNKIGIAMLLGFPFTSVSRVEGYDYWFTGILYDANIPGKVVGVIPNSPADKAGIKAGDVIKKCSAGNNQILKKSSKLLAEKSEMDIYHFNFDGFALTRQSGNRLSDLYKYSKYPFVNTYLSRYVVSKNSFNSIPTDYDKNPPVFTVVGSDKKTRKVTITPIEATGLKYILSE